MIDDRMVIEIVGYVVTIVGAGLHLTWRLARLETKVDILMRTMWAGGRNERVD